MPTSITLILNGGKNHERQNYTSNSEWGKNHTFYQRRALHSLGYMFNDRTREWVKQSTGDDIQAAQIFCRRFGFHLVIDLPEYRRSNDYRQKFFDAHPGIGKGELYFCSYCGCLLGKEHITIDHLISVDAAQKSKFAKWILHCFNLVNVNDTKNLAPSCRRCNQQKDTKSGLWLLRGLIGRHAGFWLVFWPIFFIGFMAVIIYAVKYSLPTLISIINFIID